MGRLILSELSSYMLREYIYDRDSGVCFGCSTHIPFEEFEVGHLIERSVGGLLQESNLAVMCWLCNRVGKPVCLSAEDVKRYKGSNYYTVGFYHRLKLSMSEWDNEDCSVYHPSVEHECSHDPTMSGTSSPVFLAPPPKGTVFVRRNPVAGYGGYEGVE